MFFPCPVFFGVGSFIFPFVNLLTLLLILLTLLLICLRLFSGAAFFLPSILFAFASSFSCLRLSRLALILLSNSFMLTSLSFLVGFVLLLWLFCLRCLLVFRFLDRCYLS